MASSNDNRRLGRPQPNPGLIDPQTVNPDVALSHGSAGGGKIAFAAVAAIAIIVIVMYGLSRPVESPSTTPAATTASTTPEQDAPRSAEQNSAQKTAPAEQPKGDQGTKPDSGQGAANQTQNAPKPPAATTGSATPGSSQKGGAQ